MSASFIAQEQRQFEQEVTAVKQWWAKDRFKYTTRPYSAEDG